MDFAISCGFSKSLTSQGSSGAKHKTEDLSSNVFKND